MWTDIGLCVITSNTYAYTYTNASISVVRYWSMCCQIQTWVCSLTDTNIQLGRSLHNIEYVCTGDYSDLYVVGYKFESVVGYILLLLNIGLWMLGYRYMPVALRTELLFMPAKDTDSFWAAHWKCESSVNKRVFFFKKENKGKVHRHVLEMIAYVYWDINQSFTVCILFWIEKQNI